MGEKVLVFKEERMEGFISLPGISMDDRDWEYFVAKVLPFASFIDRDKAESDPAYKQIIPYHVIRKDGRILCYKRTKSSGESRLHEKWSVGIGGHINDQDATDTDEMYEVLSNGTTRELTEELEWGANADPRPMPGGLIYDPNNAVGLVHFGLVIIIDVICENDYPRLREDALTQLKWLSTEEAIKLPNLENWSRMVLEELCQSE